MGYQVGDKVIHWVYGLGEIIQMDVKNIHEHPTPCFVVRIRDLSIWVTADDKGTSNLRRPTSPNEFDKIFAVFHSPAEQLPNDRFERKKQLGERMKGGNLISISTVIRDLTFHRGIINLNYDDKSMLKRAKNFLLDEWSYSLSIPMAQADTELGQLLGA